MSKYVNDTVLKRPMKDYVFVDNKIIKEIEYAKTFASNGYVGRVMGYHGSSGNSAIAQLCNGNFLKKNEKK